MRLFLQTRQDRQAEHYPDWLLRLGEGELLLKGHRVQAFPTVIEGHEAVIDTLEEFIKRLELCAARRLPIGLPRDREPTRDDLRNVPRGIVLVHFQLT
jgi:hypothetical protein